MHVLLGRLRLVPLLDGTLLEGYLVELGHDDAIQLQGISLAQGEQPHQIF